MRASAAPAVDPTCMKISRPVIIPLRLRSASSSSCALCFSARRSSRHFRNVCTPQTPTTAQPLGLPPLYKLSLMARIQLEVSWGDL